MSRTLRGAPTVLALLLLLTACSSDGLPSREPETTGVVAVDGTGPVLTDSSDPYYEGLSVAGTADTVAVGADGDPAATADLEAGARVDVWVGDACAESRPVQCTVEALRVQG